MAARARFKKLTDLYVRERVIDLPDGTELKVRPLNSFERDECLDAAQIARARVVMALKEAGSERLKVEAALAKIVDSIRDDPDWAERIVILERSDLEDPAHELVPEELELLNKINVDYFEELQQRRNDERELQIDLHAQMDLQQLRDAYEEAWLDKRGRKIANDEYLLTEIMLATHFPDGERVFENKAEIRELPAELYAAISEAVAELAMGPRDPKDSGSDQSSSESSPPPSEAGEWDNSGSEATPTRPRGTSPQLSTTP